MSCKENCGCFFLEEAQEVDDDEVLGCEGGQTNRSRCLSVLEDTWLDGDPESGCLAQNLCEQEHRRLSRRGSRAADAWLDRRKIVEGKAEHLDRQQRYDLIEGIHKVFLEAWWQDGGLGILSDPLLRCEEPLILPNEIPNLRDFLPLWLHEFVTFLLSFEVNFPSNQDLQNWLTGRASRFHAKLKNLFKLDVPPHCLLDALFCALCDQLKYYQTLWVAKVRGITLGAV